MNWVDVAIIAIMVIATIKGYLDGLVVSLLNVTGIVVAIIAAKLYFRELAGYIITNTQLYDKLYAFISKGIEKNNAMGTLFNTVVETGSHGGLDNAASAVSTVIIYILSILAIYFAVRLAFTIILHFLNALVELPVLKQFNRLGGIVIGFAKGILGIMILFALCLPLTQIFSIEWLTAAINQSSLAVYFCQYNFIISWAAKMINSMLN